MSDWDEMTSYRLNPQPAACECVFCGRPSARRWDPPDGEDRATLYECRCGAVSTLFDWMHGAQSWWDAV